MYHSAEVRWFVSGRLPGDMRLSFEAFGDEKTMQDGLDLVIDDFFKEPPPLSLSREASFSYPVWLQRV